MNGKDNSVSRIFVVISGIYITCLLLSNIIAGKVMEVGNISLASSVILFPITYIFGDVFTEVYGFKNARLIIWLGFICSFFAVVIYVITLSLPYPEFWTSQEAYQTVLGTTPRVFVASLVGYLAGGFSNSIVLSWMKVLTKGKMLWLRTIASTIVGEAFDTVLFIGIAFWGTMAGAELFEMILFQYLFKVLYEAVLTPLTYVVVRWMKKKENIDVFDDTKSYKLFSR